MKAARFGCLKKSHGRFQLHIPPNGNKIRVHISNLRYFYYKIEIIYVLLNPFFHQEKRDRTVCGEFEYLFQNKNSKKYRKPKRIPPDRYFTETMEIIDKHIFSKSKLSRRKHRKAVVKKRIMDLYKRLFRLYSVVSVEYVSKIFTVGSRLLLNEKSFIRTNTNLIKYIFEHQLLDMTRFKPMSKWMKKYMNSYYHRFFSRRAMKTMRLRDLKERQEYLYESEDVVGQQEINMFNQDIQASKMFFRSLLK